MKVIYKYALPIDTRNTLDLPMGTQILSLIAQDNKGVLYCLVPTGETNTETYEILQYGTGEPIATDLNDYTFLGTISLYTGNMVVHAFYKKLD